MAERPNPGFVRRRISPQKQLDIINARLDGKTQRDTAKEYGVSQKTVEHIWNDMQRGGSTSFEVKRSAFMSAVEEFGTATMNMLKAQAEMLSDQAYTKNQRTEEVIAHSAFIRDSFERIVRLQAAVTARVDALPEGTTTEIVRAEIVDAA